MKHVCRTEQASWQQGMAKHESEPTSMPGRKLSLLRRRPLV